MPDIKFWYSPGACWGNGIGIDMSKHYPGYASFARALMQRQSLAAAMRAEAISDRPLEDQAAARSVAGVAT
jgi:hypothetical protein